MRPQKTPKPPAGKNRVEVSDALRKPTTRRRNLMEPKSKISLTIDGNEVTAEEGMTILEAAQHAGIQIPTLCHHPALSNWGGCRMCVVAVEGVPRLVASCVMPVRAGMVVVTNNEKIVESRRTVLEFIFAERNHNCMFCPKSGDCELQQLAYDLQMDHLTVSQAFTPFPVDVTNAHMGIDHNRCILCGRCVRACAELAGNHVLAFQNRGPRALVGLDLNETLAASSCYGCGICLQVCPTGAIFNRHRTHYAVKGHAKNWHAIDSHCPLCGLLCPTRMIAVDNTLLKVEGRLLDAGLRPDRGQLCVKGRFEVLRDPADRLRQPLMRTADGQWKQAGWEDALDQVAAKLNFLRDTHGGQVLFGAVSAGVSNEVLLLFRDLMIKGWSAETVDTFDGADYREVLAMSRDIGDHFQEASWKQLPDADFVFICGTDLCHRQPLLMSLLRRNVLQHNTRVAVIGPTDSTDALTSFYLPAGDEDLPALLDVIYNAAAQNLQGPLNVGGQAVRTRPIKAKKPGAAHSKKRQTHEASKEMVAELVRQYLASKQPLMIAGEALLNARNADGLRNLARLAQLKSRDSRGRLLILKRKGNSAGAWKLGIAAQSSASKPEGLRGGIVLLEGESATDSADWTGRAEMDFLAVISPYLPANLRANAHVLIPRPSWLEEAGTYTAMDGHETAYVKKTLQAPEGVQDTWQTLLALAERAGYHPLIKTLEALTSKVEAELNFGPAFRYPQNLSTEGRKTHG
jgi:formate dehydrogenase major subunit